MCADSTVSARRQAGLAGRAVLVLAALIQTGCQNAPLTGRPQFVAIPEREEIRLGEEAWRELLLQQPESEDAELAQLVERVGRRLAAVAGRPDYAWEFKLLASDNVNAFCLPGGKVGVYEGILPLCQNEAGLAVVMSHEIAHALARHGNERMTQQGAVKVTGGLLDKVTQRQPATSQERWRKAYGLASTYGLLLPYSRQHETEADSIGLTLMARAGYDPAEAPLFWERFAQASGPQPPEFLSTHPADEHRASHLRGLLPQAIAIYDAAPERLGRGVAIRSPVRTGQPASATQLAGLEFGADPQAIRSQGGQPAAFATEEFVPPIERPRTAQHGELFSAFDGAIPPGSLVPDPKIATQRTATPSGPPPFPSDTTPNVQDGWQPAGGR